MTALSRIERPWTDAELAAHVTGAWPIERLERLVRYMAEGLTYVQVADRLGASKGAIAGKCGKMGIRRPQRSAEQTLNAFAEALAETGDIAAAALTINVGVGRGKNLFTELRRRLGWQAR